MKILVLEALGLHLGYLGCYGNDWVATPNLDRIAAEGIVFDWHFTDQPELQPATPFSARSVASGCYAPQAVVATVPQPRVVRCERPMSFADDVLTATDAGDGWLWIEGPNLVPPWTHDPELLGMYFDEEDQDDRLTAWIDPPLVVGELDELETLELQNTYAAVITMFDAQMEVIAAHLPADTLLCVTARSGLPLGEHGMIGTPRPRVHDELVHVPLLMRMPDGRDAGLRIAALTQPIDLLPTFLETLGQPAPPMHGKSLWPLLRGEVESIRPHAFASMETAGERSLLWRTPTWALHMDPTGAKTSQLFMKPDDRWEVNDLYQQQIENAEPMEQTLRAFSEAIRRTVS